MSLFGFGKKKEQTKKEGTCCCSCSQPKEAMQLQQTLNTNTAAGEITSIKVLGAGCRSCKEQYEQVKAAVQSMHLSVEVEYMIDMEKIMAYGIMSMPAIVVNEKVVSMGQVLKAVQVEKMLRKIN